LHFKGKVINVAEGKLALETADGNVLTLYVKATSHFVEKGKTIALAQLRENDTIDVDVEQNAKGSFVIIEARLAARTAVDEEAGAPKMRRGVQAPSSAPRTVVPLSPDSSGDRRDTALPAPALHPQATRGFRVNCICPMLNTRLPSARQWVARAAPILAWS